jgi:hypothetical protein
VIAAIGSAVGWGVGWGATSTKITTLEQKVIALETRNEVILEKLFVIERDTAYIRGKLEGRVFSK